MDRMRRVFAMALAAVAALALSACQSVYSQDESPEPAMAFGQGVDVSVEFDVFGFYHRGPYDITIVPQGVQQVDDSTYVVVDYTVNSTEDGESAEFATATTAINLLSDSYGEIEYGTWRVGDVDTLTNPRSDWLEVGTTYRFYIPLEVNSLFGGGKTLAYVTVSDRSRYYGRNGETYWYPVS